MKRKKLDPNLPALTPDTFMNRELSTLEFQKRVLAQAQDETIPLLERAKFLAIVGNNMDEFFMVRVPSYLQKMQLGIFRTRPDGLPPGQLLRMIRQETMDLFVQQRQTKRDVLAALESQGVFVCGINSLEAHHRQALSTYFEDEVYPVLTPLAVDHARPFPFISNLSLNLGVFLKREIPEELEEEFARIKVPVPDVLPRLIDLNVVMEKYLGQREEGTDHLLWIEEVIIDNLNRLFPGMSVIEAFPFRILRNADIDYEHEQETELLDVKAIIEESVRERRFGSVVRLSVPHNISKRMLGRLIEELEIDPQREVYMINGFLGSSSLFELMGVDRPDLKYIPHVPRVPDLIPQGSDIFSIMRRQDIILHHPYDSFGPVEEFYRLAARDPDVLAIKATLYRVGKNSPIVDALLEARDNEKQVTVLVELKARFDEENNLEWARALEDKGVHVVYGVEEIQVKTHAKVTMVVRREIDGVRRYVHLGTGNYNASTARLYTDLGLFTSNKELADDATRLFNRLTGYAPDTAYSRLLVAPDYLLDTFLALIDNEIQAAHDGYPARLIFKMNQLEEDIIIQKLYEASQAGVQIDLIVRGLCCLRPSIPGISENIRVRSIIGRFLEHSRIYYFSNAPEHQQIYIGSADLMRRNLYNRVEVVFPLLDPRTQRRALRVLHTNLQDNVGAWELLPDGTYNRIQNMDEVPTMDSQSIFMDNSFGLDALP